MYEQTYSKFCICLVGVHANFTICCSKSYNFQYDNYQIDHKNSRLVSITLTVLSESQIIWKLIVSYN